MSVLEGKLQLLRRARGLGGGVRRTHSGALEQRHVSVMVAVTQKLTGWRDVKGEIYQD